MTWMQCCVWSTSKSSNDSLLGHVADCMQPSAGSVAAYFWLFCRLLFVGLQLLVSDEPWSGAAWSEVGAI